MEHPIHKVQYNDYICWCDNFRTSNAGIIFMSLFGNHNAVRAIWAALIRGSARRAYEAVEVAGHRAHLDDTRYLSVRSVLSHQVLHLTLLHPTATTQVSPFNTEFRLVNTQPEVGFFPRFSRMCPIPVRAEWRDDIWRLGKQHGLITELSGFGDVPCHTVVTDGDSWKEVIASAIQNGELK